MFQSDCRINLVDRIGENYILKATLDEFDEYRMKKNMSDEMKYKEKVGEPLFLAYNINPDLLSIRLNVLLRSPPLLIKSMNGMRT